jgi:hypothetical protein
MYITNIRHLLDASAKMQKEMPQEVRDLTGFLKQVVDTTTKILPYSLTTTDIRCFKKGCYGSIKTALIPRNDEIHWYCPDCEAEGIISGWQKTEWDNIHAAR